MSKFIKEKLEFLNTEIPKLINKGLSIKEMAKELNVSISAISRRCKALNLKVPNHHNSLKFDNTVFDSIDTEEKAYWLGFLYADGNVHNTANIISLSLKISDIAHLEKFKTFLNATAKIVTTKIKVNNKFYEICKFSVCNKYFKEQLISLGCIPKKSLILKFPKTEIFQNKNLIYDFIRGYVDGDGCLTFSKNGRLNLSILGTKEFLESLSNYFPGKFKSIYRAKRLKTNVWTISNCGAHADDVTYKLYANAKIYLDRKYERFAVLNRKV